MEPLTCVETGECKTCGWVRTVRVYNSGHIHFVAIGRIGGELEVAAEPCSRCAAWSDISRQLELGGDPLGDDRLPTQRERQ